MTSYKETKIILSVLFGVLAIINLTGNILTCVVVKRMISLHTPMYYLLVNLCVANIIMAVLSAAMYIFSPVYQHPSGQAGEYLCKFITGETIFWIGGFASGFSLVMIAYERYRAVVYPHDLSTRLNPKRLKVALAICWICAILLNLPNFSTIKVYEVSKTLRVCKEKWEGTTTGKVWSVILVFISFICPLTTVTVLYSRTVYHLYKRQRQIIDVSQMAVTKVRKRITIVLIAITVLFAVCWTPDGVTYIYFHFSKPSSEDMQRGTPIIREIAILLVCFNSAIHPFLCAFTSQEIRRGLKRTICRKKDLLANRPHLQRTSRRLTISLNATKMES